MAPSPAWRMFRRMQDSILAVAVLVYAGAVLWAWQVLPGPASLKLQRTLIFPGLFLAVCLAGALFLPMVQRAVRRHLLNSYRSGFGQTVISVLAGTGVLVALAGFIFWQIHRATQGGPYPGGAFSGYAAGIGLLAAQAILARRMERDGEQAR